MRRFVTPLWASVALAVLSLGAFALQDERRPAPASAQSDKVELPAALDSWYKIMVGELQVGFSHALLQRSTGRARWDYLALTEVETEGKTGAEASAGPQTATFSIQAQLDDTYAPTTLRVVDGTSPAGEVLMNLVDTGAGRRFELVLPNATRKSVGYPSDEDFYMNVELMLLAMRQNEQLSRPGTRKAKVFSFREDGPPVQEVAFEVAQMTKREYLGKQIPVTKITFIKSPVSSGRDLLEAYVDKYGRITETTSRGGVKALITKGEEDAVGKESRLRSGGRRDPFRKDLAMLPAGKEGPGGVKPGGPEVQAPPADKLAEKIEEVGKWIEDLKKAHEASQLEDAEKQYQKILANFIKMREVAVRERPDLLSKVDDIKKEIEKVHGGAKNVVAQARRLYVGSMQDLEQENCAEMEKKIVELRKFQERPELFGTEELVEVAGWVGQLDPLLARCKTRMELARKKLTLTGTVSYYDEKPQKLDLSLNLLGHAVGTGHDIRFIQATHFAIINDKMYKVGDVVEGEGVRVERIWTHGVQVSLKEETREVGIRQ